MNWCIVEFMAYADVLYLRNTYNLFCSTCFNVNYLLPDIASI